MKRNVFLTFLLFVFVGFNLHAQGFEVTGKVTSADDGSALPGVSVVVQGTTIGAVTNFEGEYAITVPEDAESLMFSFVGMTTKVVPIEGQTVINVALESTSTELDEVVVTALGITREEKALGYAVQEVDGEDLNNALQTDAVSALSGRVAGVQISSSTNMGGSSRILIRGANSITQNNQPLFIVDGIPMDNSNYSSGADNGNGGVDYGNLLNDLNPDEIENVSVLKGPAAAIYGSRAANGVVIVTTKRAKAGRGELSVEVNSNLGFDNVYTIPLLQREYGGGAIVSDDDGGVNGFEQVDVNGSTYSIPQYAVDESWGPAYDPNISVVHWDGILEDGTVETRPWVAPEHDVEDYWETGRTFANSIALNKSGRDYGVRFAYKNTNTDGTMPNSWMHKNDFKLTSNVNARDNVRINASLNYISTKAQGRPELGYSDRSVGQKFFQWGQRQLDYEKLKEYQTSTGQQRTWNRISFSNPTPKYSDNPYWTAYENYSEDTRNRMLGTLSAEWEIVDDLVLKGSVYGDYYNFMIRERIAIGSQAQSEYYEITREFSEFNFESILSYSKQFDAFSVSALAGANQRLERYDMLRGITSGGLSVPDIYNVLNSNSPALMNDETILKQVNSVFAQANAEFGGMFFLDASYRIDWSSTLPEDNNQYDYPSVAATFLFSEILDLSWMDMGKVRLGWAEVGNDTDPYNVFATYTYNADGPFAGYPRLFLPDDLLNVDLRAETTRSLEAGVDLRVLQDRVDVSATYFNNTTFDQIMPLQVSQATGYATQFINAGEMVNKGVEASVGLVPVRTSDFEWSFRVNYTKVNNELVELYDDLQSLDIQRAPFGGVFLRASVGDTYGMLWGHDFIYDEDGNKVVGDNGYWEQTPNLVPIGSVLPDYTMGIRNNLRFKNVDLSFLIDIRRGGYFYSLSHMWGMYSGMLEETAGTNDQGNPKRDAVADGGGVRLDGVTGDITWNDDGTYTVSNTADNETYVSASGWAARTYHGFGYPSAQSVFKADYIKLRELTLGYNLGSDVFGGAIKGARIALYGRNLLTWGLDKPGFDPEMTANGSGNIQGLEGGLQPMFRTVGVNLKLNF